MNIELKNCPFCGGDAELRIKVVEDHAYSEKNIYRPCFVVRCKQCHAYGSGGWTGLEDASDDWDVAGPLSAAIENWDNRFDDWEGEWEEP